MNLTPLESRPEIIRLKVSKEDFGQQVSLTDAVKICGVGERRTTSETITRKQIYLSEVEESIAGNLMLEPRLLISLLEIL